MGERISQKILKSGRKRTPKNKIPATEARIDAISRIFEYIFLNIFFKLSFHISNT
jgi:hypothetical protein